MDIHDAMVKSGFRSGALMAVSGPVIGRLAEKLEGIYTDRPSVSRVWDRATLAEAQLPFAGTLRDLWHCSLRVAEACGKLPELIAVVRKEYPNVSAELDALLLEASEPAPPIREVNPQPDALFGQRRESLRTVKRQIALTADFGPADPVADTGYREVLEEYRRLVKNAVELKAHCVVLVQALEPLQQLALTRDRTPEALDPYRRYWHAVNDVVREAHEIVSRAPLEEFDRRFRECMPKSEARSHKKLLKELPSLPAIKRALESSDWDDANSLVSSLRDTASSLRRIWSAVADAMLDRGFDRVRQAAGVSAQADSMETTQTRSTEHRSRPGYVRRDDHVVSSSRVGPTTARRTLPVPRHATHPRTT